MSQGVRDSFWLMGMQVSEIAPGDDDQIVPIGTSAELSAKLVPNTTLKSYPGAPHGLAQLAGRFKDDLNQDLLGGSPCDTRSTRREEAKAQQDRLQRDDHDHTYIVRKRHDGGWEVVRVDLVHRTSDVRAERGKPADPHADPRPSLIRQIPPCGPLG